MTFTAIVAMAARTLSIVPVVAITPIIVALTIVVLR